MAYNDSLSDAGIAHMFQTIGAAISARFKRITAAMINNSSCNARLQQVERLNAKSDAELRSLGIQRENIVHHVFRDIMYL